MATLTLGLHHAGQWLRGWMGAIRRLNPWVRAEQEGREIPLNPPLQRGTGADTPLLRGTEAETPWPRGSNWQPAASPSERYATDLNQFLALFRFFSFALGAGIVFSLETGRHPSLAIGALITVGLFDIGMVLWRLNPGQSRPFLDNAALALDVMLSVSLVLISGGLASAFLIYSLAPILAGGLLTNFRTAAIAAAVSSLAISGEYVAGSLGVTRGPSILTGNFLVIALLYSAVCFMAAALPFQTNLNWQRRMRALAQQSERVQLRRDIHDNVAQTLAFLSLKMKRLGERSLRSGEVFSARDVNDIGRAVERSYLAVRDYLDGAEGRDSEGPLGGSLSVAARKWSQYTGLPVSVKLAPQEAQLSSNVKYHLLQITREALANVAKHSSASRVWVEMKHQNGEMVVRVRDDGKGFAPSQPRGHGLNIMNERAAMIGASLAVSSNPGQGTEVVVTYVPNGNGGGP